jgi:hypothetical protein
MLPSGQINIANYSLNFLTVVQMDSIHSVTEEVASLHILQALCQTQLNYLGESCQDKVLKIYLGETVNFINFVWSRPSKFKNL